MGWTVETLNETVDAEVEALPEAMRARPARIAKLIEEPRRNFAGGVRDGRGPARGDCPGLEENGEDGEARDRRGGV